MTRRRGRGDGEVTHMNYDTPSWGKDDRLALSDESPRSRRGLIIGVAVAVVLALVLAWFLFHKKTVAQAQVAQATLAQQRAAIGRLDFRAPHAGRILTRGVEPGQIVSAGSGMLFRMAKDGLMELRAQLSEGDLATLKVGDSAEVTPVGSAEHYARHVWQISTTIAPQTRQGIAKIALAYTPALRPGGFAAAAIHSGTSDAPQLPNSAIQSDDKG